jgi:osmoprotectant transport system permease protein
MAGVTPHAQGARQLAWLPAPLFDRLGFLISLLAFYGLMFAPFATFRANRIVPGEGYSLWTALPGSMSALAIMGLVAAALTAVFRTSTLLRFMTAIAALLALATLVGIAGETLTPEGDRLARVSPASGFWIMMLAFALMVTDALARMAPKPLLRMALLVLAIAVLIGLLAFGLWDSLSLMKEYRNRSASFWTETATHLKLAFGSTAAAVFIGVPLGIVCHRMATTRSIVLNVLNVIQTVPSMAMFGLLIAPLGWLAASVPLAAALGIRGIGMAPAFLALFLYSLLPVVANTVAGLAGVSHAVRDAARGMGMTSVQRLLRVELPLAFPVLLTGIRIVLVQNIGLATIAALIGGGGFGVFVFQGIGQMAMDLVLLGALPTVLLAFSAAIMLDALVELSSVPARGNSGS